MAGRISCIHVRHVEVEDGTGVHNTDGTLHPRGGATPPQPARLDPTKEGPRQPRHRRALHRQRRSVKDVSTLLLCSLIFRYLYCG